MRKSEFRWSEVRVSLFLAIAGIVLFALVFFFGLAGTSLARTATVYGKFDDISGLGVGSAVEMSGVVVGQIARVELPELDSGTVSVTLQVDREALRLLGASSVAFTSSHALVGQRYVGLTVRKASELPLRNGAMVLTRPNHGFEDMPRELNAALLQVTDLLTAARQAVATLDDRKGTLGRLLHEDALYSHLDQAAVGARNITQRVARGEGVLGELVADPQLASDVRSSIETVVSTTDRIRDGKGVLGRLTNDEDSTARLDHALANLDTVTTRLTDARGTLGALISDPALLGKLTTLMAQMDSLVADIHRNPQRYLKVQAF